MSNFVFVLDTTKKPLNPVHPGQARRLLKLSLAAVFKRFPFTIILKEEVTETPKKITLKLDPGSRFTGIALVQDNQVIWGAELQHRGQQIKDNLTSRRQLRRGRRGRKTRYRKARFLNRKRPPGWLAPSLQHRVDTTLTWVKRLMRYCPINSLAVELVKFDLQKQENPEISGVEYQHGTLMGCEIREYLLAKFNRTCKYCGAVDQPLEIDHIYPKSKGGSDRISNLTLSCHLCNQKKGTQDIKVFLTGKSDLVNHILKQAKTPLKDAAAVNSTRWKLFNSLKELGLPIETGSGGLTKFNRKRLNVPKTHFSDAACVGQVSDNLSFKTLQPLLIKATGHGCRQRCRTDKFGFPQSHALKAKFFEGFQTGDLVSASIPSGKFVGQYVGRIAIRFRPSFVLQLPNQKFNVHPKYLTHIHRNDGYNYAFK
ncbi:HNH endonuclease [Aphanothece hegewaldii CCALA 016]|uniref:HNH endonuclease n=1 Tax=Aphanothece hegewaldii CCALA 016 TaxID=2107694 RepID=A0A2T1LRD9_9CHRO|nr:RNA-guided endonuclease IscB [Aphanothece hegewaldii]PSF31068.1 HNH endonuclease [Aphanothece hegewaldii CCALA 016]